MATNTRDAALGLLVEVRKLFRAEQEAAEAAADLAVGSGTSPDRGDIELEHQLHESVAARYKRIGDELLAVSQGYDYRQRQVEAIAKMRDEETARRQAALDEAAERVRLAAQSPNV